MAGYPFGGIVLNLNVATKIHRDPQDLDLCLIIPISDCAGGELVLWELGLVLAQRNGDLSSFPSGDISHYNLDYIGYRASVVFHSDHASVSWTGPEGDHPSEMSTGRPSRHLHDRNGWARNIYLRRS